MAAMSLRESLWKLRKNRLDGVRQNLLSFGHDILSPEHEHMPEHYKNMISENDYRQVLQEVRTEVLNDERKNIADLRQKAAKDYEQLLGVVRDELKSFGYDVFLLKHDHMPERYKNMLSEDDYRNVLAEARELVSIETHKHVLAHSQNFQFDYTSDRSRSQSFFLNDLINDAINEKDNSSHKSRESISRDELTI